MEFYVLTPERDTVDSYAAIITMENYCFKKTENPNQK